MPAEAGGRTFMSDRFIIELNSGAVGIVVRDCGAFRFYAANHAFDRLEGRLFNTPQDAHNAAVRHQAGREGRPRTCQSPQPPLGPELED